MISLVVVFAVWVIFFGLIGFMRGWTKEVVATAGLVLSLFVINQFGTRLISLAQPVVGAGLDPNDPLSALKRQFYILTVWHILMAFFSYQGTPLASQISGGRLGSRFRASLQERLLGAGVGLFNGYLIMGALWSFLEYRFVGPGQYEKVAQYAFNPAVTRPATTPVVELLLAYLPLPFLTPYLIFALLILFLFVIIVII